jgi:hypothetical protein
MNRADRLGLRRAKRQGGSQAGRSPRVRDLVQRKPANISSPASAADPVRDMFVFGSDLAGHHTVGDALIALRRHGAVYGRAVGLEGRSYAIPVRDEQGKIMPVAVIARYVSAFLRFAAIHRELTFHVSRIGCEPGGYRDDEIAPLFKGAPPNCDLPRGWTRLIERRARP